MTIPFNTLRFKRRRVSTGDATPPETLYWGEPAFNDVDKILWYGWGNSEGDENISEEVIAIGGEGAFTTLATNQTLTGEKTFSAVTLFEDTVTVNADIRSTVAEINLLIDPSVVNFASSADINMGKSDGTTIINSDTTTARNNLIAGGILSVNGGEINSEASDFAILPTSSTITIGDQAGEVVIGSTSGTTRTQNDLFVTSGVIDTEATTASIFNTSVTTAELFGETTDLVIGAETGSTKINNNLNVVNGIVVSDSVDVSLFDNTNHAVTAFTGSSEISIGADESTVTINDDVYVSGDTSLEGALVLKENLISLNDINSFEPYGPTDDNADGGGFVLMGITNKSITWSKTTNAWESSESVNLATDKSYQIQDEDVLSYTELGSSVVESSLTSVGVLTEGTWQAETIEAVYGGTGHNEYEIGDLLYANSPSSLNKLAKGSAGQILIMNEEETAPEWASTIDGGVYAE